MKKVIFLLVACVSLLGTTLAMSSPYIDLGGGAVKPTQTLSISLDKLVPSVAYDVTCKVNDPNNPQNQAVMVVGTTYTSGAVGDFYLNGQDLGPATMSYQFALPQVENELIGGSLYKFCGALNFTNADQQDSVAVMCSATPVTMANKNTQYTKERIFLTGQGNYVSNLAANKGK